MMASVVSQIHQLGTEAQHIPGKCTVFLQPVYVGVFKPF